MRKTTGGRQAKESSGPKLFAGLSPDQKRIVVESAERRLVRADEVVIRTGEAATSLFLLTKGKAKFYRVTKKGEEVLLWWLAPDDTFGLGALIAAPVNYIGTAQTLDECEMLVWTRDKIRSLAATYKLLSQNGLHIILDYLAIYTDRFVTLATGTAEERLAHTLLQLARKIGLVRPGGVELPIRNEDLAALANVSPFTASRQLNDWERQGLVQKTRGRVVILSPEGLVID
jgi:CRP-like cAMP-binding protein